MKRARKLICRDDYQCHNPRFLAKTWYRVPQTDREITLETTSINANLDAPTLTLMYPASDTRQKPMPTPLLLTSHFS